MEYFGLTACRKYGFPYIYAELTAAENAPDYEAESYGLAELEKVLAFVRNDTYYPTFEDKCAYVFCSIAGSQYFSNGNKRLAVTVLLMFLMGNKALVLNDQKMLQKLLHNFFPVHGWEDNSALRDKAHSLFLYNLAIVVGDRKKWSTDDFALTKRDVAKMFSSVYRRN